MVGEPLAYGLCFDRYRDQRLWAPQSGGATPDFTEHLRSTLRRGDFPPTRLATCHLVRHRGGDRCGDRGFFHDGLRPTLRLADLLRPDDSGCVRPWATLPAVPGSAAARFLD